MLTIRLALVAVLLLPCFCYAYHKENECSKPKGKPCSSSQSSSKCGCGSSCAPGIPGVPGIPGHPGQNGKTGPVGPKGDPGPLSGAWKQCVVVDLNSGREYGLIMQCSFKKSSSATSLRVFWNGALRVRNCNKCCKRWFFTFNGAECNAPLPIDGIVYMLNGKRPDEQNLQRVRHIEGACDTLPAGVVIVGFNVGNCGGYGADHNANAYTGWNSGSRIYVEEIGAPQH